jgi:hypothetical protein
MNIQDLVHKSENSLIARLDITSITSTGCDRERALLHCWEQQPNGGPSQIPD